MNVMVITFAILFGATSLAFIAYQIWKLTAKPVQTSLNIPVGSIEVINVDADTDEALFKTIFGKAEYTTMKISGDVAYAVLIQNLRLNFDALKVYRRKQSHVGFEEVLVVQYEGVMHALVLSEIYKTNQPSLIVTAKMKTKEGLPEWDTKDWRDKDGGIELVTGGIRMLTALDDCDEQCQIDSFKKVKDAVANSEVEVRYEEAVIENSSTIRMFHLRLAQGAYGFRPSTSVVRSLPDPVLASSFEPITVHIGGATYNPPMDRATEIMIEMLKNEQNILILGGTGSGKTTLLGHMMSRYDGAIVKIDFNGLEKLASPEGRSALEELYNNFRHSGMKNAVFVIDEGQSIAGHDRDTAMAFLLDLMEGLSRVDHVKIGVLAALAMKEEELPDALTRPGRTALIAKIKNLSRQRANALTTAIKNANPDLVFDVKLFNSILASETKYSKQDQILLAEVWKCFTKKSLKEKWTEQLAPFSSTKVIAAPNNPTPGPAGRR